MAKTDVSTYVHNIAQFHEIKVQDVQSLSFFFWEEMQDIIVQGTKSPSKHKEPLPEDGGSPKSVHPKKDGLC